MHTEHLQNVHPGWVIGGWLVALAVTSLIALALASFGITEEGGAAEATWILLAVAVGFYAGGFFIGFKSIDAPILHAVGIGLFSLVAWLVLNLLAVAFFRGAEWQSLGSTLGAAVLVTQLVAAVAGAWTGHRLALAGGPEPS